MLINTSSSNRLVKPLVSKGFQSEGDVQFSGKKAADKKPTESKEAKKVSKLLSDASRMRIRLEKALDDEAIQKQLRINEFLGITPKKYLNKFITASYNDIKRLEKMKAEYLENFDKLLPDNSGTVMPKGRISEMVERSANSAKDANHAVIQLTFDEPIAMLQEGIEKLETIKKEQFGLTERYNPDANMFKKFAQRHGGKLSKNSNSKIINTGLHATAGIAGGLLLGPFGFWGAMIGYDVVDDAVLSKLQRDRLEKAYLNEIGLTVQKILVKELAYRRLSDGVFKRVEVLKRPDDFAGPVWIDAPSPKLKQEIADAIQSDLQAMKKLSLVSKDKVVKVSVLNLNN